MLAGLLKAKCTFMSAENSGQHTSNVDLHQPLLEVFISCFLTKLWSKRLQSLPHPCYVILQHFLRLWAVHFFARHQKGCCIAVL